MRKRGVCTSITATSATDLIGTLITSAITTVNAGELVPPRRGSRIDTPATMARTPST